MKHKGLIFSTVSIFLLGLYLAYNQIGLYADLNTIKDVVIQKSVAVDSLIGFQADYLKIFNQILNGFNRVFSGSLVATIMVLALIVELITLYPAVRIQLKQKKIHLFHKKLVDRFHSGELTMSENKRELDVLYAVNEQIHKKGALLISFQLLAFVAVLFGLYLISPQPETLFPYFDAVNYALLAKPLNANLPLLVALAYLLHSLIKISLKQKEDYLSKTQIRIAFGFSILASVTAFFFATLFSSLLSIYLLAQITFASMRYLIVENNAAQWGKMARKELIKTLRTTRLHRNRVEHASQKFNHLQPVRILNFHLLEEGISMSLAFLIALNALQVM